MSTILKHFIDRNVAIVASDGRFFVGCLKSFDQSTNVIISDCVERVFSEDSAVEFVQLGLYVIRGDNIAVVGEIDEDIDRRLNFSFIRALPIQPITQQRLV